MLDAKAQFYVTFITQINKSVIYSTVKLNVKFGVLNADLCTKVFRLIRADLITGA